MLIRVICFRQYYIRKRNSKDCAGLFRFIMIVMSADSDRKELNELKEQIRYHNYRYHVLDQPIISDAEFDQLLIKLREIESQYPDWVSKDSPTQRVGATPASKFDKVRHPAPVLSLGNAFSDEDVIAWYERISKLDSSVQDADFVVEPKFDGLTVVLHYQKGIFVRGVTRGDGEIGEDITNNIRTIKSVPLRIPVEAGKTNIPEMLVIRGEALIKKDDFEALNKKLEEKGERTYQNPRNTAAGSLRQLDPALTAERPITLFTYAILAASEMPVQTQWGVLDYLRNLGFPVSDLAQYCENIQAVLMVYQHLLSKRDDLLIEVDGVVIKINDLELAKELGTVGKDPRGSLAYKFPAQEVTTKLLDIGINVGRTGVLTPYAILEPVEIGGVNVRQATLHNFDYIKEKDIRVGDRVLLKRAGDVIPYIIGPIQDLRDGSEKIFKPPATCPSCGQEVANYAGEVAWYCVNNSCPAQLIRNIEHFVSRSAMDIEGLGVKIVKQLVDAGMVNDVSDLYTLHHDNLKGLEGFADKKAKNIEDAIQASKSQTLDKLIYGLGIKGIGEVAAMDLAQRFVDLNQLRKAGFEELQSIEGFGPNMARSVKDWFNSPNNINLLMKLRQYGIWPINNNKKKIEKGKLSNKLFVVTGKMENFSREEVREFIRSHGGKVTDSISRNTDYLVCGEDPGSKLEKAHELGIPVISEEELKDLTK